MGDNPDAKVRELFIEELAEVQGGSNPIKELKDQLNTTMACCEEGPHTCC